ncbi:hypothetical protein PLESTF_001173700 [Pleodorina starrii]|nr:hypothetical protein PLESTF_001173700 [Pleodorina starrii]
MPPGGRPDRSLNRIDTPNRWASPTKQRTWRVALVLCCLLAAVWRSAAATLTTFGPWDASQDLNEQHKAVLRFILSGDTSFWSRPEVATRIGFGTAPWRCVNNCQAQYYASALECAPDCTTQTYCEPGGAALSDPNTTCCALSLLDQSYSFSHPPNATTPDWCSTYPACSLRHTPAWHHPSIDLTRPPEFSLVDDLVCLPLEEIYFEDVSFRPEHELLAVIPDRSGPNGTTFDL